MKKTYINPQMEIVKIATIQMLAESFGINSDSDKAVEGDNALARESGDDWE
ncbi:MAG: hypothetical protein J1E37_06505 [Prevotella sp.]|nr:hypothetical protein [Prevotella sp.]